MTNEDFLSTVERFLAESNMKPTPFGVRVLGDPSFVRQIRNGRSCSLETVGRVLRFIEEHRAETGETA